MGHPQIKELLSSQCRREWVERRCLRCLEENAALSPDDVREFIQNLLSGGYLTRSNLSTKCRERLTVFRN